MIFEAVQGPVFGHVKKGTFSRALPEINPLDFDVDFEEAISFYGLDERHVLRGTLEVAPGQRVVLDGTLDCGVPSMKLSTSDLDRFKRWIGLPDEYVASGKAIPALRRPSASSSVLAGADAAADGAMLREVELAAGCYLFGDSRGYRDYASIVEAWLAPFEVAAYAIETLVVHPTATLEVRGYPTVLLAREAVIHQGGSVKLHTIARVMLDELTKPQQRHLTPGGMECGGNHGQ